MCLVRLLSPIVYDSTKVVIACHVDSAVILEHHYDVAATFDFYCALIDEDNHTAVVGRDLDAVAVEFDLQ